MASRPIWSSYDGDLLSERGLFYGDGLFETILIANGRPRLLDLHLGRLRRSAEALRLEMPDRLTEQIDSGLKESGAKDAVLKIVLSRQASARGYAADPDAGSHCLLLLYASDAVGQTANQAHTGVDVCLCTTRLARQPVLAGHKHLNRLEQVLARSEWQRRDIAEGLMLDTSGNLIEGTASNLFLVRDGVLTTPDLKYSGVAGVMREWVMREAYAARIEVQEAEVRLSDLENADEMFLTNALMGIRPVANYVGLLPDKSVSTPSQQDNSPQDYPLSVVKQFEGNSPSSFAQRFVAALSRLSEFSAVAQR